MKEEKVQFVKWWFLIAVLLLISIPVFWALGTAGLLGRTVAERMIFEQSYQKKAGDASKAAIFRAQLSEIELRLRTGELTDQQKTDLEAQRAAIRVQLSAVEGN